ncbi:MAG: hypothetical protein RSE41_06540 [Clostridia bacterium]
MKKLIVVIMSLFMLSNVNATIVPNSTIIDSNITSDVIKLSDTKEIYLPFLRLTTDRLLLDKDTNKSGLSVSGKNIDVTHKLGGVQVITSQDTIKIDGSLKNALLMAPTVIINGAIDDTVAIVSEKTVISDKAILNNDAIIVSGNLDLKGNVLGSVIGIVGDINIEGNISKDLRVKTETLKISDNSKIDNKIYVESYEDINIQRDNFSFYKLEENKENQINYLLILANSIILASIFLLIDRKSNIFKNMLNKFKTNYMTVVLSGFLILLLSPFVLGLSLFLILFGLSVIVVPILVIYIAFIVVAIALSLYIVGSLLNSYILTKLENKVNNIWYKLLISTAVFAILFLLTSIQFISGYASMLFVMLTTGMLFTNILKK